MRILATQYTLATKSLEIYLAGCKGVQNGRHCPGCHNPESWDFNQGQPYNEAVVKSIRAKYDEFRPLINNIMILGGEPLDNPKEEILELLCDLAYLNTPVWLFTRYELSEIDPDVLDLCDYIKCGPYDESQLCDDNEQFGIKLASRNQHIYQMDIDY